MGVSIENGPSVISGFQNPQQNDNPEAGPSLAYAGAGLLDPRFERGEPIPAAGDEDDCRTVLGQYFRKAQAEPARGTRDERHLS